jgi:hypothetical protein
MFFFTVGNSTLHKFTFIETAQQKSTSKFKMLPPKTLRALFHYIMSYRQYQSHRIQVADTPKLNLLR